MSRYLTAKRLSAFVIVCYIVAFFYIQMQVSSYGDPASESPRAHTDNPTTNSSNVDVPLSDSSVGVTNSSLGFVTPFPGLLMYSAYLDKRQSKPNIRIVALVDKTKTPSGWCHFWPPDSAVLNSPGRSSHKDQFAFFNHRAKSEYAVPMVFYETCEGHGRRYVAFIITCAVPSQVGDTVNRIVVSKNSNWITDEQAESSSPDWLEIPVIAVNNKPGEASKELDDKNEPLEGVKRLKFAACIPPLFGTVSAEYLIEFIELTRILGADHFFFYSYEIQEDVRKLLHMYTESRTVTVLPWKHGLAEEAVWYYGQSAAIADCLYRTMGHFDWVAFNDIDEFMVPRDKSMRMGTWEELISYEKRNMTNFDNFACLGFQSAIFDISGSGTTNISAEKFLTMRTVSRTASISRILTKQFIRPERVFELGIHHLSKQFREQHYSQLVKPEVGLLHHYRKCRPGYQISCRLNKPDKTIQRYEETLRVRAMQILNQFHTVTS